MMSEYTDKDRIDFLEKLLSENHYTGKAILRMSARGLGFRLHESSNIHAKNTVRETIDTFMKFHRG